MTIDYEFIKQIILVSIPVIAGIITSKLLTNSWQIKKEKMEIKRKILDELDRSYGRYYSLLANFTNHIYRGYDDWATRFDANGKPHPPQIIFPSNLDDFPINKFKKEFQEFLKNYDDIAYSETSFGTSLALHLPERFLVSMNKLDESLELAFITTLRFLNTTDKITFEMYHELIKENLEKARTLHQELAFQIIRESIMI